MFEATRRRGAMAGLALALMFLAAVVPATVSAGTLSTPRRVSVALPLWLVTLLTLWYRHGCCACLDVDGVVAGCGSQTGGCGEHGACNNGTCICSPGFGGAACQLELAEMLSVPLAPAAAPAAAEPQYEVVKLAGSAAGQQADFSDIFSVGEEGDPAVETVLSSDVGTAAVEAVPGALRNVLLLAQHLNQEDSSHLAAGLTTGPHRQLFSSEGEEDLTAGVGCGFYDVFYEGCAACRGGNFYGAFECEEGSQFYDSFYGFDVHTSEYQEDFSGPLGDRSTLGKTRVHWTGAFTRHSTPIPLK